MTRFFAIVLLAAVLGACASQQRTEPPAPVVTAGKPSTPSPQPQTSAAPSPRDEEVEVYAYRPPSTAPDAVPHQGSVPAESGLPADGSPISESATTGASGPTASESAPAGPASSPGAAPLPEPAPPPAPQVVAYAPPPSVPTLLPAADVLAKHAEQQRQAGDYVGAAATLERALRIQPQETSEQAYLWNRLASVRMEQGLYSQAGNLASRSNSLSKDQPSLKQNNWAIIAAARRAAGDTAGAMEAERKARGG